MNTPILSTTSLTAISSSATPLQDASAPEQDLAGQTAFERIAPARGTPASIPPHTPDWTNLKQGDPGVSSLEAFAWLGETTAYRAVASSEHRAHHARTGTGVAEGLAVDSERGDAPLSISAGEAVALDGSTAGHDVEWKYVSVRRYFAYLTESIGKAIEFAVFEPDGETSWENVRAAVSDLLLREWQAGALKGTRPEEAFFVKCDRSTMTQDDIDNGRLVVLVGVATVRPAEFVILRFSHKIGVDED